MPIYIDTWIAEEWNQMLTTGFSLKYLPCPRHCQKNLQDWGCPETATSTAMNETFCNQMHASIDHGKSFQKGIIRSMTRISHLTNNRALTMNLFPSYRKKGFLQVAGPEVPIHSLPQSQCFSGAVKAVHLLVHYKTGWTTTTEPLAFSWLLLTIYSYADFRSKMSESIMNNTSCLPPSHTHTGTSQLISWAQ